MAKLEVLPEQAIIDSFKGTIDFYLWMGIPCARKWPFIPPYVRSPQELATHDAFAWAAANWKSLSPEVVSAYNETAQGSSLSGRDLFVKSFISDYFREGQWYVAPPPIQYLNDLRNVEVPAPSDGELLTWETASTQWKAK
ncbi:unnamed protein product [marine sediment metagenome]|uniref:Uncharacterized protein n=1 Tax=marine sediment metagenome TaxID=412755 RepID=X1MQ80_9ZZZZ